MNINELNSYKVSYFSNISNTTNGKEINISDALQLIKQPKKEVLEIIQAIRSTNEKQAQNELKKQLPYITISGTFKHRSEKGLISHSGLIQIDFDNLGTSKDEIKAMLKEDRYFLALFDSPSGNGLKGIVKIDSNPDTHKSSFLGLEISIFEKYNLKIDKSCKDISRAMYLSYDENIYINPNSLIFSPLFPNGNEAPKAKSQNLQYPDKANEVERILQKIESQRIDITVNYNQWLKIGFSFADFFGSNGFEQFHRVSQFYTGYNYAKAKEQFEICLKTTNGKTSINTFFEIAKQKGIDISLEKPQPKQGTKTPSQQEPPTEQPKEPQPEAKEPQTNEATMSNAPQPEASEKLKRTIKKLEKFVRIGDTFFENIEKPDKFGKIEKTLVRRQKGTILDDYGKDAVKYINKFKDFCLVPSHTDFKQIVGNCYNLYFELEYKPKNGSIKNTMQMLEHIFQDKIDIGLDYLTLLYNEPTQILPVLCLVSEERNTGKSTFGQWIMDIYGQNAVKLGNADLANDFNAPYAQKLAIVVDESFIDKKIVSEAIKRLSTEQGKILVNSKGLQQYEVDFIGKFIFISNNEENFINIGRGENRYLVLKVPILKSDDTDILNKLRSEIPAFLKFLKERKLIHTRKSRMFFDFQLLETEHLIKVIEASKSPTERAIYSLVKDTFEAYNDQIELEMSANDIWEEIKDFIKWIDKLKIIESLKKDFKLIPKQNRYKFYSLKETNFSEFLPDAKRRNNKVYLFKVQDFLGEEIYQERIKNSQKSPEIETHETENCPF